MVWYWWVLIAVGCIAVYLLKVILLKRWQKNAKMKQERKAREREDE